MKKLNKFVLGFLATLMIAAIGFAGVNQIIFANPQQNDRIIATLQSSRNANNVVTATPAGRRVGGTENAIRMRLVSNAISSVNGMARDNITEHPWTTQMSPRLGHPYTAPERSRTIVLGFMEAQVEARRNANDNFGARVSVRRSW